MEVIKVAIADDHKIFRKGVVLSLRPFTNIKFVLEADSSSIHPSLRVAMAKIPVKLFSHVCDH